MGLYELVESAGGVERRRTPVADAFTALARRSASMTWAGAERTMEESR
jgi:hypothetical protein